MIRVNLLQPKGTKAAPNKGFGPITIGIMSSSRPRFPQPTARQSFAQKVFSKVPSAALSLVTRSEFRTARNPSQHSTTERETLRDLVDLLDRRRAESWAVLEYLAKAESKETDVWLRDDIRIAWGCVLYAAQGFADAWGYSFWQFFGRTYPRALLAWAERDAVNRKALERCAALVRAERQAREGAPLCGEGAEKPTQTLPRGASLAPASTQQYKPTSESCTPRGSGILGGEPSGTVRESRGANLYDSARAAFELPSPKDRKRAA